MRKLKAVSMLIIFLFMVGCAGKNIGIPETPRGKIHYGYVFLDGVYSTVNDYLDMGLLSEDDARKIVANGKRVRKLLDLAKSHLQKNKLVMTGQLWTQISAMLLELNRELMLKRRPL